MKRSTLAATPRTVLGKKVKQLRREGSIPANIYGKDMESVAIQVKTADFLRIYKEVGETGVVNVELDGKQYPSMMKGLQMNFQLHQPLHVDFHKVNLKEKIKATIAVVLTGESLAVNDKLGMLIQPISEIEVEALPDKLPDNVELSIESLTKLGSSVTVADIKASEDVVVLTDPAQIVAKIAEIVVEPEPEEGETTEEGTEDKEGKSEGEDKAADDASEGSTQDKKEEEK